MSMILRMYFCWFRYENNIELYRDRVKECVQKSIDRVFDPPDVDDQHYIQFNKWNSNIYEPIRQKIYEPKVILLNTKYIFIKFNNNYY